MRKNFKEYMKKKAEGLWRGRKKKKFSLERNWAKDFPSSPGVYLVFEKKKPIYVGETKDIRERMKDLRRTYNHTLRKSIGKEKFNRNKKNRQATGSIKFHPTIEKKLDIFFVKNIKIAYDVIDFGRKEIEEYICNEKKPKYNSISRRGQ